MGRIKLINEDNTKTCIGCKKTKPLSDFYLIKASGFYQPRCKPCHSEYVIKNRDLDKFNIYRKNYGIKNCERVNKWYTNSRSRRDEYFLAVSGMTAAQVYRFNCFNRKKSDPKQWAKYVEEKRKKDKAYRDKNKKRKSELAKINYLKKKNEKQENEKRNKEVKEAA